MKKLKYFFASAIVLVAVAISTIVFAEYKEQKGDLRVGNTISNKNVSVNAGSSNLINDGDVKVVKTVSKTDAEGVYNVKFDISAKEKENTNTTPIYAVVVFDNSGSMICDSAKRSYAKTSASGHYSRPYTASLGDEKTIYCSNAYDSSVVLNDKWESAVKGTKSFTNEILSIDSSKISYVTFADYASNATQWYKNGDNIPKSVYGHPIGGTNLSDAINKAYNKLSEKTIPTKAKKIIIVISDGEPDYVNAAYNSANKAKKAGIKIYSIGYAVDKDSTAANVLKNVSSNSANDTTNYSFLAGQDNVSNIFKKLAADITTVYAKDATLTDTIGGNFKFTSSNDNVKVDGQNVSFSIDKLTTEPQSFSFNITIDDENITEDGWYPTNDGFNLTYTDVYGNSQKITSPEDPEVYWVAKRYDYKIEYYYDRQIDDTLTKTGKDVKGKEITVSEESIKNNTKEGYSFVNTDPSTGKIVISSTEKNVIRVYYERNSYDYEVHYFFNGNEDESLIDRKSAKYNDVINTYTDKVKTGYKLDRVETLPLTIKTKGNVINVYYVTDETQTKELSYTVEYYKDGNKVANDTQVVKKTKQVLESDTLTVKKGEINVTNKYVGYKFEKTNPETIPNSINDKGVIKVYYVKDMFEYTINYYYNGKIDNSKTESSKAKYETLINTYPDKKEVGYKLEKTENLPLTVTEDKTKNVIKVYYVTDEAQTKELSYTVEYYKDGNKVANDTQVVKETKQVLESDTLTVKNSEINVTDKYVGYSFVKTEPSTIPNSINDKGVIRVYYERNSYDYEVHYFFNGNEDESLIERKSAKYNDVINTYTDKVKTGYKFEKTENLPLTVTEDKTKNVINVYYVTDENQTKELSYTVEYYKDGNKVANDTQVVKQTKQVLESDTLTVEKGEINVTNKYVGYKFEKTNPETIPNFIEDKGVIKVYYVTDENQTKELSYTVEYYKDGEKVTNDTQVVKETKQVLESDTLTVKKVEINVTNKYVGYKFEKTNPETIPNSINDKGVIKVYYVKDMFEYTINYYYNGKIDNSKTERSNAKYETVINTYPDKKEVGYKLEKTENLPLTVTEDKTKNVIKVYYVTDNTQTKNLSYTVEYYKDGKKVENDTQVVKETKQVLESDTLTVKKGEINVTNKYVGYKFEKTNPETIPNSIEDKGIIKVYYVFDESQTKELSYTVEYYKNGKKVENDTQVETVTVHVLEPNTLKVNQDKINTENKYVGYKLEKTNPETIPSEINNGGIIKVYYILDDGQTKTLTYTVNYYKDGNLVKEDTETIYETKQVLESDTLTVKSEEINIKDKYVGYKFVKTNPELIPEIIENKGVIDVYYEKDTFTYEVRYYFNRELDESLTEKKEALYGDKITSYTDKVKEDYTLETVENLPLVISEDESKNIINVYYKIDGQGVIEPIEPPHTSTNNSIYALILLVNALGASVLLKKREN